MVRGADGNDTAGVPTDLALSASGCHMACRSTICVPVALFVLWQAPTIQLRRITQTVLRGDKRNVDLIRMHR